MTGNRSLRLTVATEPRAPKHLSETSRRTWRAVVEQWQLDPTALLVLEGGLVSWDLYARARAELEAAPALTVLGGRNVSRQVPAAKVMLDALKEARLAFGQLKLELPETPEERWTKRATGAERKHERTRRHG